MRAARCAATGPPASRCRPTSSSATKSTSTTCRACSNDCRQHICAATRRCSFPNTASAAPHGGMDLGACAWPRGRTRRRRPRHARGRYRARHHRQPHRRARAPHRERSAAQHVRSGGGARSRFPVRVGQPGLQPHQRLQRLRSHRPLGEPARQRAARPGVLSADARGSRTQRPLVAARCGSSARTAKSSCAGSKAARCSTPAASAAITSRCSPTSPTRSAPNRNCATWPTTTR